MQEEIAKDVAQALSITLDVGETSRATGGTTNVEAYDKYLQARALTLQGDAGSNRRPSGKIIARKLFHLTRDFRAHGCLLEPT